MEYYFVIVEYFIVDYFVVDYFVVVDFDYFVYILSKTHKNRYYPPLFIHWGIACVSMDQQRKIVNPPPPVKKVEVQNPMKNTNYKNNIPNEQKQN